MPTTAHVLVGLPAWATDEEAREAAEALGYDVTQPVDLDGPDVQPVSASRREAWRKARAAAIVARAEFIKARAWAVADQLADIIRHADMYMDALVVAAMGVEIPEPPVRGENRLWDALYDMGEPTPEQVQLAMAVIRQNEAARKAARMERQQRQRAAQRQKLQHDRTAYQAECEKALAERKAKEAAAQAERHEQEAAVLAARMEQARAEAFRQGIDLIGQEGFFATNADGQLVARDVGYLYGIDAGGQRVRCFICTIISARPRMPVWERA